MDEEPLRKDNYVGHLLVSEIDPEAAVLIDIQVLSTGIDLSKYGLRHHSYSPEWYVLECQRCRLARHYPYRECVCFVFRHGAWRRMFPAI